MNASTHRLAMLLMIVGLSVALVIQAVSGYHRRQAICARSNSTLDVLHDVIIIASTPPPGKTFTAAQVRAISAFQAKAFARIDRARC